MVPPIDNPCDFGTPEPCGVNPAFTYTRYPCDFDDPRPATDSRGLPVIVDLQTPVIAEVANRNRESTLAIEAELGIQPSGTFTTVRARLDALEALLCSIWNTIGGTGSPVNVLQDGITIVSAVEEINFTGTGVIVTDDGDKRATITITGGTGVENFICNIDGYAPIHEALTVDTPGQTDFELTYVPYKDLVLLFIEGIKQELGDYTIDGYQLTWNGTPLITSDIVEVFYTVEGMGDGYEPMHEGLPILYDGQTDFILSETAWDNVLLFFVDGVKQEKGDYVVDGYQVTWNGSGLTTSNVVEVLYYKLIPGGACAGGGSPITVADEGSVVETNVTLFDFVGPSVEAVGDGYGTVTVTIGGLGTVMYQDVFTATPGQTNFSLLHTPINEQSTEMFVDGVSQTVGVDYNLFGTTIVYGGIPLLTGGEEVVVKYFESVELAGGSGAGLPDVLYVNNTTDGYNIDFENSSTAINLSPPVNPQDAATKAYVDAIVAAPNSWAGSLFAGNTTDGYDAFVTEGSEFRVYQSDTSSENAQLKWDSLSFYVGTSVEARIKPYILSGSGAGTSLYIEAGDGVGAYPYPSGGNLHLRGGNSIGSEDGGNVYIVGGNASGTGADGYIYIQRDGTIAKWNEYGQLDVYAHRIVNVEDPVNPQDAVTKNYVDGYVAGYLPLDGSEAMSGDLDLGSNNLINPGTSTFSNIYGAATDGSWGDVLFRGTSNWERLGAGQDGYVLTTHGAGNDPTWEQASSGVVDHGALTGLGDDDHTQYILVDGTRAFTGTISGVTPVAPSDLATKGYIDGYFSSWGLPEILDVDNTTGGTDIDFQNTSRGINVLDPINPQDVATKNYVDLQVAGVASTWSDALSNGNTTDGYNPIISTGDVLQGESDLNLQSAADGYTIISAGSTEIVRFGLGSLLMQFGDSDDAIIGFPVASGNGVNLTVQAQDTSGVATAGDLNLLSGSCSAGNGGSGDVVLASGTAADLTGAVTIQSGDPTSGTGSTGVVTIKSGDVAGGTSGNVQIYGGDNTNGVGVPGDVDIKAGGHTGSGTGIGSFLNLYAGSAVGSGIGGSVFMQAGDGAGGQVGGSVTIKSGNGLPYGSIKLYAGAGTLVFELDGYTISAETQRIENVVDPINAQDAATKNYVDLQVAGVASTWSDALSNGNTTDGYNPEISNGDQIQAESGFDLILATYGDGYTIINNDDAEIVRFGTFGVEFDQALTSIDIRQGAVSSTHGAPMTIAAQSQAATFSSWDGGTLTLAGGKGGAYGNGGDVKIVSGEGGSSSPTRYDGSIEFWISPTVKVAEFSGVTLALDVQANPITNVQDPTNPQDAATKNYVDGYFGSQGWAEVLAIDSTTGGTKPQISEGDWIEFLSSSHAVPSSGNIRAAGSFRIEGRYDAVDNITLMNWSGGSYTLYFGDPIAGKINSIYSMVAPGGSYTWDVGTGTVLTLNSNGLNAQNKLIQSVLDPVNPQDAATKYYVDSQFAAGGVTWADTLAAGNTTDGYNPEISAGDRLQAEDGSSLELFTSSSGSIILNSDGYVALRSGGTDVLIADGSTISAENQRIENVVDPVNAQDAVTKSYLDGYLAGLGAYLGIDILVQSVSDLPVAVAGIITLAPNTVYGIDGLINLGTDRIALSAGSKLVGGGGSSTSSELRTSNSDGVVTMAAANTAIEGLILQNTGAGPALTLASGSSNYSIVDTKFISAGNSAITVANAGLGQITDSFINVPSGGDGIRVNDNTTSFLVKNTRFKGVVAGNGNGVNLDSTSGTKVVTQFAVESCRFEDLGIAFRQNNDIDINGSLSIVACSAVNINTFIRKEVGAYTQASIISGNSIWNVGLFTVGLAPGGNQIFRGNISQGIAQTESPIV